jgi:hypothetical protein
VSDVAAIDTDVTAVAAIDSDVTAVAGVASDIPTVADNVSNINDYANTYQGAKATAPTLRNNGGALLEGDMYFNTTSDTMFVYGSGGWVPAGSSVNGTSQRYKYVATSGQTSFSGTDANGNTLTYDAGFIDVYLNGVHLDPTDYTATTGTSIVLGSGAALNDELYVVAFGTFNVASFNGSGLDDGTVNISKLNATGTRDGTTFLAGDNTFKTVAVTPTAISDQANTSTGYMMMPVGTTAQRPGTPAAGMYRMNTTTNDPEWYDAVNSVWVPFRESANYTIEYLVIAGGGGGSQSNFATGGGAGGAGGYRSSVIGESSGGGASAESPIVTGPGSVFAVTVGAGGSNKANGSNSSFDTITSIGGGCGGGYLQVATGSGGSGGGSAYLTIPVGSGTTGQGYAGGSHETGAGGGGGGAGSIGGTASANRIGGNGGSGVSSSITGTSTARAGGGGGGATSHYASPAVGGTATAGGGNGGANTNGFSGTANTGGGGGGPLGDGSAIGGSGGSGVVIIRYAGAQRGVGGVVTSAGGYTIHTFTSSGTFTS